LYQQIQYVMTEKQNQIVYQLECLVTGRFTIETLNEKLSKIFNEDIKVTDITDGKNDDDTCDWNLLFSSKNEDTYGFFDIYYLKMRKPGFDGSDIYITEVSYEFE
jgi:hypothetical protein